MDLRLTHQCIDKLSPRTNLTRTLHTLHADERRISNILLLYKHKFGFIESKYTWYYFCHFQKQQVNLTEMWYTSSDSTTYSDFPWWAAISLSFSFSSPVYTRHTTVISIVLPWIYNYKDKIKTESQGLTWCILRIISDPPINSPLMNICGNVGQLLQGKKKQTLRKQHQIKDLNVGITAKFILTTNPCLWTTSNL